MTYIDLLTKEDLAQFKAELIQEIKDILKPSVQTKSWLRSVEVRRMLNISPGTLQNLRINGTLKFTQMGSIIYYKLEDIEKILGDNSNDFRASRK